MLRVLFSCRRCHRQRRTWSSSRVLSGLYLANQKYVLVSQLDWLHCHLYYYRLVHGFTCAGVLPTQYINFAKFSGIGSVGHGYIRQGNCHAYNMVVYYKNSIFSVYNRHGYIGIVDRLAEQSMQKAVEEVQTLPDYTTKGEVI